MCHCQQGGNQLPVERHQWREGKKVEGRVVLDSEHILEVVRVPHPEALEHDGSNTAGAD